MEVIGAIVASLGLLILLAGLGLTTLAAFVVMTALGLLSNWSFKRIFFISFAVGLLAPVFLAVGIGSAIADGSLERDLRDELGEVIDLPIDGRGPGNWRDALPKLRELGDEMEEREMEPEEIEARIKEAFQVREEGEDRTISIEGGDVQISDDGVKIQID